MTPRRRRPAPERWLATARCNVYYRFRVRESVTGECTIEVPFRKEFERPGGAIAGSASERFRNADGWVSVHGPRPVLLRNARYRGLWIHTGSTRAEG